MRRGEYGEKKRKLHEDEGNNVLTITKARALILLPTSGEFLFLTRQGDVTQGSPYKFFSITYVWNSTSIIPSIRQMIEIDSTIITNIYL